MKSLLFNRVSTTTPNCPLAEFWFVTIKTNNMKKVIFSLLAVGLLMAGCKEKVSEDEAVTVTVSDSDFVIPDVFKDSAIIGNREKFEKALRPYVQSERYLILDFVNKNFASFAPCDDNERYESAVWHSVGEIRFLYFATRHLSNQTPAGIVYGTEQWDAITTFIKDEEINCNDGWLNFAIATNGTLQKSRVEVFDPSASSYSELLFTGIENELNKLNYQPHRIKFTKGICPVKVKGKPVDKEKIIFYVESELIGDPTRTRVDYFDMSDYPS